ncbi:DUF4279 domain-containing protein [Streptomyces sp. Isolate_45]|uniref:DUF4279 domain-containing protein n=1 Tax=Streptomyces sp. Isolate_45 TaxID=2950111 RepID=UPI002481C2E0|nr:DUF4279 domain-containing protein [Streptomyces sp. Isolate_45]MDA5281063.1 DUF4279 domain-containing protein [Streptomyces sp. Isolate_45]
MPFRQYVYFALSSRRITAQEITDALGIEPDETQVHNRRGLPVDPARPFSQSWKVVCREPGLCVDEQIAHVLGRLRPRTDRIVELMKQYNSAGDEEEPGLEAWLEVVRYFNDDEQQDEAGTPKERDDRNLSGWALDRETIAFLAATGTMLDVDEYDMTPSQPSA